MKTIDDLEIRIRRFRVPVIVSLNHIDFPSPRQSEGIAAIRSRVCLIYVKRRLLFFETLGEPRVLALFPPDSRLSRGRMASPSGLLGEKESMNFKQCRPIPNVVIENREVERNVRLGSNHSSASPMQ